MVRIIIIIALNVIMYARTLNYAFVIDDKGAASRAKSGKKWKDRYDLIRGKLHYNSKVAHSINLILHTLNCCLIYFAFGHNNISFLMALLFAVNPVNNQVSVWLAGRAYGYVVMLLLLSMIFPYLFVIFYPLNFVAKVGSAMLSPLLFIFLKPHLNIILLLVIVYNWRIIRELFLIRWRDSTSFMKEISWRKLIIMVRTYGYNIFMCFFPYRLAIYHTFLYAYGLTKEETEKEYRFDKYFWLGYLTLCILICLMIIDFNSPYTFGLFWFTLFIGQWTNFVIVGQPVTERYAYLPNIGLMYILANLIIGYPVLIAIVLTAYIVRLYYYIPAYRNSVIFAQSNVDSFPDLYNAYNTLGAEKVLQGKFGFAIDTWIDGLPLRDTDFKLNYNIGNTLLFLGNFPEAMKYLVKARKSINMNTQEKDCIPEVEQKLIQCHNQLKGIVPPIPLSSPSAPDLKQSNSHP